MGKHLSTGPGRRVSWRGIIFATLAAISLGWFSLVPRLASKAAPNLTLTPDTWNVVGLDASNVNTGPNTFPVGARLCNTGDSPATNIVLTFVWDTENQYIGLSGSPTQALASLQEGRCVEVNYTATVSRDVNAIENARRFHITAAADSLGVISTPIPREIYVKGFSPQNDLTVTGLTGPDELVVGRTYTYNLTANAADTGYNQLVHAINFPSAAFRVQSISAQYATPPAAVVNQSYADACGWEEDPTDPGNYLSCVGPPPSSFPGGIVSGTLNVTYTVQVIAAGAYTLTASLYGYTNGAYLIQADFGQDLLPVVAQVRISENGFLPLILKQFPATHTRTPTLTGTLPTVTLTTTGTQITTSPTTTATGSITPRPGATKGVSPVEARIGQNFTFTIRVVNNGTAPATNVRLEDSFSAYTYLDIFDLSTSKGTRDINGRVARVTIGTLDPGEVVTVRVVVRVNNTAPTSASPCNTARITYSTSSGVNSNSQCFRVTGGSSLPPTGELPLEPQEPTARVPALLLFLGLGAAGIILLRRGRAARVANRPHAQLWLGSGSAAALMAIFAGLAACGWFEPKTLPTVEALITQEPVTILSATPSATLNPLAELPAYMFATPDPDQPLVIETLPSYPIPSPSIPPELAEDPDRPDTSAVRRMEIPKLDLDAPVAYVPYDGQSWKIQGLREEVAWMGDTSWPGLGGNTAFAGHVTVRGLGNGPFRYLNSLLPGDEIRLYTEEKIYIYKVRELKVVEETEMTVTEPTEGSQITLITCVEWNETIGIYLKRLVVIADQVEVTTLASQ